MGMTTCRFMHEGYTTFSALNLQQAGTLQSLSSTTAGMVSATLVERTHQIRDFCCREVQVCLPSRAFCKAQTQCHGFLLRSRNRFQQSNYQTKPSTGLYCSLTGDNCPGLRHRIGHFTVHVERSEIAITKTRRVCYFDRRCRLSSL